MKLDALLMLQRSDIAHFVRDPAPYAGLGLIFIDPGVVEEAVNHGVDSARFDYRPIDVGPHFQARVNAEAMNRAQALDRLLHRERRNLFGDGELQGWDDAVSRLFFVRALIARELGELCERSFSESSIGIFRPTRPQQFYFDSFVATDLFTAGSPRWKVVDHYDATLNWVDDSNAACFDFEQIERRVAAGTAQAVTHIPTVYAQLRHYAREMAQTFASNIDLPSPFWDIPLQPDRSPLVPIERVAHRFFGDECRVYRERARHIIESQLSDLLTHPHALQAQVGLMADRCFMQAVNFQGLSVALAGSRPHFVLTEHDTGNIGPLFSVAARLGSDITVLPHSSYPTELLPHSKCVVAIERDGFDTPVRTVWGEPVTTRPVRFSPRKAPLERPHVATVCLLLNTLFGQGISQIDLVGLARFHAALSALCAKRGVRLLVRLKPNAAGVMIASGALGVPVAELQAVLGASLEEIATASDLCVAYGEPTTASIEFMEAGSHLMQVCDQCWPADYLSCPPYLTADSVPFVTGVEALPLIEHLLADVTHFRCVAERQRRELGLRFTAVDGRIFDAR
ncbi:MAG: hypothetical protein Q7T97_06795 [Burkholderiaceae bacterium]|nr:hypothetical protein [Burkholderiaceae bacterium]